MPTEEQKKNLFIQETLWKHGERMMDELRDAIQRKRLIDKSTLIDSLDFTVQPKKLQVNFVTYGRIHDLKRRKHKKMSEGVDTNREIWGIESVETKPQRKANRRWYASNAYGMLNSLIGTLMYGYSEHEAERMKKMIVEGNRRAKAKNL